MSDVSKCLQSVMNNHPGFSAPVSPVMLVLEPNLAPFLKASQCLKVPFLVFSNLVAAGVTHILGFTVC